MNASTPDSSQPAVPTPAPVVPVSPSPQLAGAEAVPPSAVVPGTPTVADDGDIIEPEWINKTKQVITATALDPFQQATQLNALKADYLKKRYNLDVKVVTD